MKIWDDEKTGANTKVAFFEAVTNNGNLLGVRGLGARQNTRGDIKPHAPYFLKKNLVAYFHEKPIKKIELRNVVYKKAARINLPKPNKIFTTTVENNSELPQTGSRTIEYSHTKESTVTFGNSISAGVSVSATAGVPIIGQVETSISVETEFTFETGTTDSKTFTDSITADYNVPGR